MLIAFHFQYTVNTRDLHMNQRSSSFIIPEDIRKNIKSIQLIWSKDSNTQCVCPPVEELMPRCACNAENMNRNFITISNNTVIVSNITLDVDEKKLSLFFVFSTSSGCNYDCNLRSIQRVYRLFTIPGNDKICWNCTTLMVVNVYRLSPASTLQRAKYRYRPGDLPPYTR